MKAILFSSGIANPKSVKIQKLLSSLKQNSISISEIDINTRRGSEMGSTYDILSVPALVILREDGVVQGSWHGELPGNDEIHKAVGYV